MLHVIATNRLADEVADRFADNEPLRFSIARNRWVYDADECLVVSKDGAQFECWIEDIERDSGTFTVMGKDYA